MTDIIELKRKLLAQCEYFDLSLWEYDADGKIFGHYVCAKEFRALRTLFSKARFCIHYPDIDKINNLIEYLNGAKELYVTLIQQYPPNTNFVRHYTNIGVLIEYFNELADYIQSERDIAVNKVVTFMIIDVNTVLIEKFIKENQ